MRQLGWAFGGIVAGFLLGGIGPNRELGALQERHDALQDENMKLKRRRSGALGALGAMDALVPRAALPTRTEHGAPSPPPEDGAPDPRPDPSPAPVADRSPAPETGPPGDPLDEFEAAVEVQAARTAMVREALTEQADLGPDELAELDAITAELNEALAARADELIAMTISGETPAPSALFGLTHEISGVLLESQESLEALVGEEAVAEMDPEALLVLNHVDLGIFRDSITAAAQQ